MSARSQLQSKPVADLRSIAESLGIEHKGLQKAKLIDLLVDHSDEILDSIEELDDHIQRSIESQDPKFDPRRPLKNYTGNRTRIFKYNDNGKIREIGLRYIT